MPPWGLDCPVTKSHGKLLPPKGGKEQRWWCPHQDHGGNGKFFNDKEAHGEYQLEEGDVTVIYERAASDVIAGKTTLDQAVVEVSKATSKASSQVREAIGIMIDTIREKDQTMAEKQAKAKTKAAEKAKASKQPGERRRKEHVDGAEFARVRDELGLNNKQAAEATGEAGMGSSATYIYIVTHSGSSKDLFTKFEAALRAYAKKNGIKKPKKAKGDASPVEVDEPPETVGEDVAEAVAAIDSEAVDDFGEPVPDVEVAEPVGA